VREAKYGWDCWACFRRIQKGKYDRTAFSGPNTCSSFWTTAADGVNKCPNCGSNDVSGGKIWYCGNNYTREGCHGHHGPNAMRCLDP